VLEKPYKNRTPGKQGENVGSDGGNNPTKEEGEAWNKTALGGRHAGRHRGRIKARYPGGTERLRAPKRPEKHGDKKEKIST